MKKNLIPTSFLAALLLHTALPQAAHAATYYWDNNGLTAGFGTAGGTWGSDTKWSTDDSGGNPPSVTSPTTSDDLNFGYISTGLATGTVAVTGTQSAQSLTFASGSGTIVLSGGTAINLAAASTITVNNSADTIITPLTGAGTSLTKLGTGTLTLNGANTYTGTTIIKNGALQIGDGTTGSLGSTPSAYTGALTFNGTGTFNVQEAASSNQGMGTLTFNAGQGKVQNTFNATTSTLTFSGMNARSAGATANFTTSGGTNGIDNKIVLSSTTNAPMSNSGSNNQGIFFGLDSLSTAVSYARYDATGGFIRATNYSGDTNATTTAGPYGSAVDLSLGDVTTSPGASVSLNTLRAVPTANGRRFDVGTNTLSINGVLAVVPSAGVQFRVGSTTVGQGFLQPTTDGGEVVFAVARGNNSALTTSSLAVGNIIQDFSGGSAGTKVTTESNATMVFQASNTYTGVTTINSGLLRVLKWADAGSASGLGKGSTGATPNAADIVINGGTLNYGNVAAGTPARTNRLFTIGPAGATLDNSSNTANTTNTWAIGQNSDGSSSGSIAFSDSNAPASLTLAHNAPAATQFGTGTLSAVLGDPGTGTNVTSLTKTNAGTWILTAANTHSGVTRITGGTLQLGNNLALQNSIFDPSGLGALAFSSGINTPTLGGLTSATNLTMASNVTALALNPGTGVTATYSGILDSATAGMTLEKKGAGTQVLSGANTYTGATTVSGGKLTIASTGTINTTSGVSIGAGNFNYNSSTALSQPVTFSGTGGTLSGSSTITPTVNVTTGNTLAIGNSVGVMNFGGSLTVGGTYLFELDNTLNIADLGDVAGALTLGGILDLVQLGAYGAGDKFTLFAYDGVLSGIFTGISDDTNFTDAGGSWTMNYNDTTAGLNGGVSASNTYVTITAAIPEPNIAALMGGFVVLALLRRRR